MLPRVNGPVRSAVSNRSPGTGQDTVPVRTACEDRAATIHLLQGEGRALQREIKDASDDPNGARRVIAPEADLEERQRRLATLQGRV